MASRPEYRKAKRTGSHMPHTSARQKKMSEKLVPDKTDACRLKTDRSDLDIKNTIPTFALQIYVQFLNITTPK
jgi:hypothetical protein